jgi:hypothetical protein
MKAEPQNTLIITIEQLETILAKMRQNKELKAGLGNAVKVHLMFDEQIWKCMVIDTEKEVFHISELTRHHGKSFSLNERVK